MNAALQQGQIVRVAMPDPQGRNWKRRPVVIYTPTDEIAADGMIDVVAITTQVGTFPPEVSVPLPWQRGGHPRTTLTQRNEAICTWTGRVPITDAEPPIGRVPLAELTRILAILTSFLSPPVSPPPPPPAAP